MPRESSPGGLHQRDAEPQRPPLCSGGGGWPLTRIGSERGNRAARACCEDAIALLLLDERSSVLPCGTHTGTDRRLLGGDGLAVAGVSRNLYVELLKCVDAAAMHPAGTSRRAHSGCAACGRPPSGRASEGLWRRARDRAPTRPPAAAGRSRRRSAVVELRRSDDVERRGGQNHVPSAALLHHAYLNVVPPVSLRERASVRRRVVADRLLCPDRSANALAYLGARPPRGRRHDG
jgi:hypothetical protein